MCFVRALPWLWPTEKPDQGFVADVLLEPLFPAGDRWRRRRAAGGPDDEGPRPAMPLANAPV